MPHPTTDTLGSRYWSDSSIRLVQFDLLVSIMNNQLSLLSSTGSKWDTAKFMLVLSFLRPGFHITATCRVQPHGPPAQL